MSVITLKDVLNECAVQDLMATEGKAGFVIKLPDMQLERKLYLEVKKTLETIDGKWNRKHNGFYFEQDPTNKLNALKKGDKPENTKKKYQYFATPDEVADRLVSLSTLLVTDNNQNILEPSAGRGAIVRAILRHNPDQMVDCYEIQDMFHEDLHAIDGVNLIGSDFMNDAEDNNIKYSVIIANPPFSKNQDVNHVNQMFMRLKKNGRLVAIMSKHWQFAGEKTCQVFRDWIAEINATVINLDAGTFKQSGTMIEACIVVIDKPY